jgi:hypothetical protein
MAARWIGQRQLNEPVSACEGDEQRELHDDQNVHDRHADLGTLRVDRFPLVLSKLQLDSNQPRSMTAYPKSSDS